MLWLKYSLLFWLTFKSCVYYWFAWLVFLICFPSKEFEQMCSLSANRYIELIDIMCLFIGHEWSPLPNIVHHERWIRSILVFCFSIGTAGTKFQPWSEWHALSTFCAVEGLVPIPRSSLCVCLFVYLFVNACTLFDTCFVWSKQSTRAGNLDHVWVDGFIGVIFFLELVKWVKN